MIGIVVAGSGVQLVEPIAKAHVAAIQNNRKIISSFEDFLLNGIPDSAKFEPKIKHYFACGLYAREMWLPATAIITGKIHKHEHFTHLSYGKCEVLTDQESILIEGPLTFASPVGVKRVILAHTDLLWTTFHHTQETDIEAIERDLVTESYDDLPLIEVQS